MQHTFTLAAWNFRLARRSLLALWGFFAAQQAAVILWRAAQPGAAGLGLASHYYATMQIFAYLGFYLLTALEAGLATHNSRRARSGYTWATLPGTPGRSLRPRPSRSPLRAGLCRVAACVVHRGVLPRHSAGAGAAASCTAQCCPPPTCMSRSLPTTCSPAFCRAARHR